MNILILFSQPWRVGGAETHVEALIKGLGTHTVFLAVNQGSQEQKLNILQEKYPNLTIIKIQARGINVYQWWRDINRLASLITQKNIDIVSAQQRTAGLWAYFLQRKTKVPFTVTMHDAWHRAQGKEIYAKLFSNMIVVGQHLYKRLIEDFGFLPNQITCVHNGIDFEVFMLQDRLTAREQIGLSKDEVVILHVSRLSNIKGAVAVALIKSLDTVRGYIPNVKLAIIGEGPLRSQLDNMALEYNKQHNREVVQLYNFLEGISTWYNAADLVVGEGRVAIEALACKRPVIAIRNAQTFLGAITLDNINEAITVNFDGVNKEVTAANLANEILAGMQTSPKECSAIANVIVHRLSVECMAKDYLNVFANVIKGE